MLEAQHEGRTVGFRESEREGRVASADDHEDGRVSMTLTGTSPQGEEDTLNVCCVLVRALNQMGGTWNDPVPATQNTDCLATNATGVKTELRIQVVRAIVDRKMWDTLAKSQALARPEVPVEELIDQMEQAVRKKAHPKVIPPKYRGELVLALDATRLPALALDSVVNAFRERHGRTLRASGFQSVWVVGPTETLTKRLDVDPAG